MTTTYERTTKLVIEDGPSTEPEIRTFLNKLTSSEKYTEEEEKKVYYYCDLPIIKGVYDELSEEPSLQGELNIETDLKMKRPIDLDLSYNIPLLPDIGDGYCYAYFHNEEITIGSTTGPYILLSSRCYSENQLAPEHKERAKLIMELLSKENYNFEFECKTLSNTYIHTEVLCQV